jgi:hypothetical protein
MLLLLSERVCLSWLAREVALIADARRYQIPLCCIMHTQHAAMPVSASAHTTLTSPPAPPPQGSGCGEQRLPGLLILEVGGVISSIAYPSSKKESSKAMEQLRNPLLVPEDGECGL